MTDRIVRNIQEVHLTIIHYIDRLISKPGDCFEHLEIGLDFAVLHVGNLGERLVSGEKA